MKSTVKGSHLTTKRSSVRVREYRVITTEMVPLTVHCCWEDKEGPSFPLSLIQWLNLFQMRVKRIVVAIMNMVRPKNGRTYWKINLSKTVESEIPLYQWHPHATQPLLWYIYIYMYMYDTYVLCLIFVTWWLSVRWEGTFTFRAVPHTLEAPTYHPATLSWARQVDKVRMIYNISCIMRLTFRFDLQFLPP